MVKEYLKNDKALSWTKLPDVGAATFEKVRTLKAPVTNWEFVIGQFLGQYAQWSQTMEYLTDSMKDIVNTESIETIQSLLNKGCNYVHTGKGQTISNPDSQSAERVVR